MKKVAEKGYSWKLEEIFPEVLSAGDAAGVLTEEGAKLLIRQEHWKQVCRYALRKEMQEQV